MEGARWSCVAQFSGPGPPSNKSPCGDRMRIWANRRKSRDDEKPRYGSGRRRPLVIGCKAGAMAPSLRPRKFGTSRICRRSFWRLCMRPRLSNAIKATRSGAVPSTAVAMPGRARNFPPASEKTFEARGINSFSNSSGFCTSSSRRPLDLPARNSGGSQA